MSFTPRLKAGIFVRALIRRAEVAGASAFIVRKGAEEAGAVILTLSRLDGTCLLLNQIRFDPDLWIVEIEDRQGRAFVDEPIV
jgi:hypothetical protein